MIYYLRIAMCWVRLTTAVGEALVQAAEPLEKAWTRHKEDVKALKEKYNKVKEVEKPVEEKKEKEEENES